MTSIDQVSEAAETAALPAGLPGWLRAVLDWLAARLQGPLEWLAVLLGLGRLQAVQTAGDRAAAGQLTTAAVTQAPPATAFTLTIPPSGLGGDGTLQTGGEAGAPVAAPAPGDTAAALLFRTAAGATLDAVQAVPADPPLAAALDVAALSETMLRRLEPAATVRKKVNSIIGVRGGEPWFAADPLEPIMAAPSFPQPMYLPLRDLNQDYLLPGAGLIPPDSLGAVVANHTFIEAYMVGLNHEMARQLLWNGYPTDQRGSYFRQFWDVAGYVPQPGDPADPAQLAELLKDIPPENTWPLTRPLGQNENRTDVPADNVILLVRGELLRRYPNAVIFAGKAKAGDGGDNGRVLDETDERMPIFRGTLSPDITFFGFNLSVDDARGGTAAAPLGFFFVVRRASDRAAVRARAESTDPVTQWEDLAWTNFAQPGDAAGAGRRRRRGAGQGTLAASAVSSVFPQLAPAEISRYRVASTVFSQVLGDFSVPGFLSASGRPVRRRPERREPRGLGARLGRERGPDRRDPDPDAVPDHGARRLAAAAGGLVSAADGAAPLLLLPVRIETRFADQASDGDGKGGSELWVRVYPDQITVNGHHPELTAAELAAGNAYWDAVWRAGDPPAGQDAVQAPWRGLVTRYGAPRAAWIVAAATPLNIGQRPAAPTPPGTEPDPAPQPPSPPLAGSAWDSPAVAALLPQAWTVVLESGPSSASYTGSPVTPGLAVSLSAADPSLAAGFPDGLPVDAGMRWLVDFDAAVAAGMALRIPVTAAQRQAGFDRVLVYGLCDAAARLAGRPAGRAPLLGRAQLRAAGVTDQEHQRGAVRLLAGRPGRGGELRRRARPAAGRRPGGGRAGRRRAARRAARGLRPRPLRRPARRARRRATWSRRCGPPPWATSCASWATAG